MEINEFIDKITGIVTLYTYPQDVPEDKMDDTDWLDERITIFRIKQNDLKKIYENEYKEKFRLNEFMNSYIYDDSEFIYSQAKEDGVIISEETVRGN